MYHKENYIRAIYSSFILPRKYLWRILDVLLISSDNHKLKHITFIAPKAFVAVLLWGVKCIHGLASGNVQK